MAKFIRDKRLPRAFYERGAVTVARELLGKYLHRVLPQGELVGKIVEVEAYTADDPACHAFRGKTPRNAVLFDDPGLAYIYFTYGMHHCFNVSTDAFGTAGAVLVRGIEPIKGIEEMRLRRKKIARDFDLTNGPGKICAAFALDRAQNGIDLVSSDEVFITQGLPVHESEIEISTRIGITVAVEFPWRFYVKSNPFVSRGKPSGDRA